MQHITMLKRKATKANTAIDAERNPTPKAILLIIAALLSSHPSQFEPERHFLLSPVLITPAVLVSGCGILCPLSNNERGNQVCIAYARTYHRRFLYHSLNLKSKFKLGHYLNSMRLYFAGNVECYARS